MTKKTIKDFEDNHCGSKIEELKKALVIEQTKIEKLVEKRKEINVETSENNTIRFGVTGDRHIGSLYHDNNALHSFYEYAKKRGVEVIFDAGDMIDGHKIYRGQEFELRDLGLEKQLDRVEKDSPNNIHTKFITGNHDTSFKNLAGVDVGKQIQERVENYNHLGEIQARYRWVTPNGNKFEIMLIHPGGGSAYALSYKPQKIVESLEGGTKPDMLCIGHFHKAEMMPMYRNVCTIQTGTFQRQTPFMARGGLQAHVGGWIVEVIVGEKTKIIRPEFVAFYE